VFRRIVIYVTLICFIASVQGCTSRYVVHREILQSEPEHTNLVIETIDGEVYHFKSISVHDDSIEGYAFVYDGMGRHVVDSFLVNILLEDVESVRVLKFDAVKTGWYTLGALTLAFGVFILILALTWDGFFTD